MIKFCYHKNLSPPRPRTIKGGNIQYKLQCLTCGSTVGHAIQKNYAQVYSDQEFDEELYQKRFSPEANNWWKWFDEYLESVKWKQLRFEIIRRADNICERCYEDRIHTIHHLTYENSGCESTEELLGVCNKCHEELHRNVTLYFSEDY